MKQFKLEVYYRPTTAMAKLISRHAYSVGNFNGHRCQVVFLDGPEIQQFMVDNPGCEVVDCTYNELFEDNTNYKGVSRYIIVGVSLKLVDYEQFKLMSAKPQFVVSGYVIPDQRTVNSNIGIKGSTYVWTGDIPKDVPVFTDIELQWLKLYDGFDHHYRSSDAATVYLRGKTLEDKIRAEGIKMGLSDSQMDRVYTKAFV